MSPNLPVTEPEQELGGSSTRCSCIFGWLAALVCLLACTGAPAYSQADSRAKDGDRSLLCGTDGVQGSRLLIGRFSLFGDFESSAGRSIEPAIVGTLARNLSDRRDLAIKTSVWSQ